MKHQPKRNFTVTMKDAVQDGKHPRVEAEYGEVVMGALVFYNEDKDGRRDTVAAFAANEWRFYKVSDFVLNSTG